jgi:hypothetical protein
LPHLKEGNIDLTDLTAVEVMETRDLVEIKEDSVEILMEIKDSEVDQASEVHVSIQI